MGISPRRGKNFPKVWVENVTLDIATTLSVIGLFAQPGGRGEGRWVFFNSRVGCESDVTVMVINREWDDVG